jgi:hypothetical protein
MIKHQIGDLVMGTFNGKKILGVIKKIKAGFGTHELEYEVEWHDPDIELYYYKMPFSEKVVKTLKSNFEEYKRCQNTK